MFCQCLLTQLFQSFGHFSFSSRRLYLSWPCFISLLLAIMSGFGMGLRCPLSLLPLSL